MNSCKVMLVQAKSMKSTWSAACGGGAGCVRFQGPKMRLVDGEDLNSLVDNAVKAVLTTNTCKKAKASNDSSSDNEQEYFNSETLKTGGE